MDAIRQLLYSARRRVLWVRSIEAAIEIACLLLACFGVLLLTGVDVVGWDWLWLIAGLGILLSVLRVRRLVPAPYLLAQKLDLEWGLHDTVSTAWYALECGIDTPPAHFLLSSAGVSAHSIDVKATFRVRGRKTGILAGCLLIGVCVLFGARYRAVGHLDLHPSCLALWFPPRTQMPTNAPETRTHQEVASIAPGRDTSRLDSNGAYDERSTNAPQKPPATDAGTRSTWDRLKDALSKLLNPDASGSASGKQDQEAAQRNPNGNKDNGQNVSQDERGAKATEQGRKADDQGSSQRGDAGTQTAQTRKPESGSSSAAGQKSGGAENSAQSGAGNDNGSKRIENAAELKAMGKIEELMGKQASQVSGEMSIVKTSGPQQLSTAFDGHEAAHAAADTELHDGTVPSEQREFVRRYMDELHKVTDSQGK